MTTTSRYWSQLVHQLQPYEPGEQPKVEGLVKLNTNENPYPPSPLLQQRINAAQIDRLRLYPDPANSALKQALATHFGVPVSQVFLANGSDEVLGFAFQAFFRHSEPLLFPDITYGFYSVYCKLFDIDYREVPLAEDFSLDLAAFRQPNGGIIFPNPNAPTGIAVSLAEIEQLAADNTESVIIVDEAYVDFGADSAVALVDRYPNVLVVQTFSKSRSLAGIRVGFAIGSEELIEGLERVKDSFNPYSIDRLAEVAAVAAVEDVAYFEACREKIIATRAWTVARLQALGFDIMPSQTNFIMAKPGSMSAAALFAALRGKNILVRYFNKPRISDYLRITIGTDDEMAALVSAVESILADTGD